MGRLDRISAPGPGRTLLGEAEAFAEPLRLAAGMLRESDSRVASRFKASLGGIETGPHLPTANQGDIGERAAWAVVSMWIVGRLSGAIASESNLSDAEEWFCGKPNLTACLSQDLQAEALSLLNRQDVDDKLSDLLPYVLDPVGLGTRRAVIKHRSQISARTERKHGGIYYTPSDVADFMLESIEALDAQDGDLIDPACGSGVFLRAALRRAVSTGCSVDEAARRLFGIDISAWAVELCSFVLTAEALRLGASRDSALMLWKDFRSRLICGDALRADLECDCHNSLPKHGFRYVVANPPYARLNNIRDQDVLRAKFSSLRDGWGSATNAYVPFVELMWQLASRDGSAVMVVPLSVAYSSNKEIRALRGAIQEAGSEWRFAFFDRTPDALFGDDVKQRCAILIRRPASAFQVATGPLQRWTSRTRSKLFSSVRYTRIKIRDLSAGIPKLGSRVEAQAYQLLQKYHASPFETVWTRSGRIRLGTESSASALLLGGTAYNWITIVPDGTKAASQITRHADTPLLELEFSDVSLKWAAYAFLSSRITYWLWRVEGDGFHVPKKFVGSLPTEDALKVGVVGSKLAELGKDLAERITNRPIVSTNGGRETVTYCPYAEASLLDEIDGLLIGAYGLPERFEEFLKHFVLSTTVVDFDDPMRVRRDGRALTGWVAV